MISVKTMKKELQLSLLSPTSKTEMNITVVDVNRPGMQFVGFYEHFANERVQVIGLVEMSYLESMDSDVRRNMLTKYFSYDIPCIIISRGLMPPKEFLTLAQERDVPVFQSKLDTTHISYNLITFLNRQLAPHINQHGVLVDVFGMGVLLTGDSGAGKSEAALELIKRGHQLVADDVVDICRLDKDWLVGEAPEMIRHLMEIRGLGLIDIRAMFGISAVLESKSIDMVIHLEKWDEKKEYDRLGLVEETTTILDVKLPYLAMPVKPGRNLAIIIEVAARNLGLKRLGYNAAQEMDRRMMALVHQSENQMTDF